MKKLIAFLPLLLPVSAAAAPQAPKQMAVCVNQTTGNVAARGKCKAGEAPLNLGTVAATTFGQKARPVQSDPEARLGPQGMNGTS